MTRKTWFDIVFAKSVMLLMFAFAMAIFLTVPNPFAELYAALAGFGLISGLAGLAAAWMIRRGAFSQARPA